MNKVLLDALLSSLNSVINFQLELYFSVYYLLPVALKDEDFN